jgi:hypothetical protein
MKKYFLMVLCALLLLVVTGCGNKNQVVCTGSMSEGGVEVKAEMVAEFDKDDKLTTVTVTEDLGDKEKADQMCALFKAFVPADSGVDISCSGSKVTIKGYENMADDEEDKMIGMTKEEFKKAMQEETKGAVTCK